MNGWSASRQRELGALWLLLLSLPLAAVALPAPDNEPVGSQPPSPPDSSSEVRPSWPAGTDAWLVLRTGIREGAAFRIVSTILERGRWVQADLGYFDAGDGHEYRLFWAGAGGAPIDRPGLRLELKGALSKSFGTTSAGERHFLANASLSARLAEQWKLEISHTEALPLNDAAGRQRSLDRARLEYEAGRYQLGVGYAGSQSGGEPWQHRPFVSVSRPVRGIGELEVWLQRVERADGPTERVQLRLTRKLSP